MKIIVDENVSYGVVSYLRDADYDVIGIMESSGVGCDDSEVFEIVKKERAVLITRDHHFTNSLRFPSEESACIIYIRKGNLTTSEEIELIKWLLSSYSFEHFKGRLVTLSKDKIKIR